MWTRRVINWIVRTIAPWLMKFELSGLENVPLKGRHILMFNHINFIDAPVVAAHWPCEVEAMTKVENLRSWILGPLMRLYGAFPIVRGEVDRRALSKALWVLESDRVLLMSPEGTRNREKGLVKAKDGMALLAVRTESPIVPVAIWGQEDVVRGLLKFNRAQVRMVVGKPFCFEYAAKGRVDREALHQMTQEAMYVLAEMLPLIYRGYSSDLSQATRQYVRFLDAEAEARPTAA